MQQVIEVRRITPFIRAAASLDHAVAIAVGVVSTPDDFRLLAQARDAMLSRHGDAAAAWLLDAVTPRQGKPMPKRMPREQLARLARQRMIFCLPRHPLLGDIGLQAIASGVPLEAMNLEPWPMAREIAAGSAFLSVAADCLPQLSRQHPGSLQ
ncbi:MAG: hypothetical protein QM599_08650 [Pseudoxanthomonas sp.]